MNTVALRALGTWLPSPLLKVSAGLHVALAGALIWRPAAWPLVLAAFVADHLILSTVGLVPRGTLLGPNVTRLPDAAAARGEVAITIDDGPDPDVTPRVLDLLAAHGARATFFCVGTRIAAHPELAQEIVRRGHAIENHTARHSYAFSLFGPRRIADEIASAQRTIRAATGRSPRFFRAPGGLRNPLLQPALTRAALRLASWTRRGFDTVNDDPSSVARQLLTGLRGGDILLLHDGNAARTRGGTPVIVDVLPVVLEALRRNGLHAVTLEEAFALSPAPRRAHTGSSRRRSVPRPRRSSRPSTR
jgi:peptidoglycan/xylan/chitin deacetylase (PgdA/CDA1 family)